MIFKDLKKRLFTSISLLVLLFLIFINNSFFLFFLMIFGIFSIIEFFNKNKEIAKSNINRFISNILFTIFIFIFCTLFFLFSNLIHLKILLFIILLGCIASDMGGYIFGRIIKGPKLTKISPKKTISGAVGSLILSTTMINFLFFFYFELINIKIIFIGIFTSIGCQLGDLFFSYLKRKANLKDTGNFLPGHGGILDRVDGILFGVPVGTISFILIY